jgi:hypothetical protein
MSNRGKPNGDQPSPAEKQDPETESTESTVPAEPLNRAERRALRRGKKPSAPPAGPWVQQPGHHEQVRAPRRAGRRGNR